MKFRNQLEKEFTDEDWLHCLYLKSIKTRFDICKDENGKLRFVSMLRETDSNLQAWNSDPNASGSRTWPQEEIEQSIDLRIDGITNDETYTDEQYMQRIAEQVQKLKTTKEILKYDSPKDNILSEKAVKKIHEAGNCELHEIQLRTNKV